MAKVLDQCHVCRRAGVKLYLKAERCHTPKCAIVRRNYAPGVKGIRKGKPRLTTYGLQLREKQKARMYYNISERQLRNYFDRGARKEGNTGENLLALLEMRLDNIVQRLGWTPSHRHARQMVGHGAFLVDGKKVNIPSYQTKPGQVISLSAKAQEYAHFKTLAPQLEKLQTPGWVFNEKNKLEGKILGVPTLEDAHAIFDMRLIIEFYSR